jgi:hypothetical protein
MTPTILIALGALIAAVVAGALLAPLGLSAERQGLRGQWPAGPAPRGAPQDLPCPH